MVENSFLFSSSDRICSLLIGFLIYSIYSASPLIYLRYPSINYSILSLLSLICFWAFFVLSFSLARKRNRYPYLMTIRFFVSRMLGYRDKLIFVSYCSTVSPVSTFSDYYLRSLSKNVQVSWSLTPSFTLVEAKNTYEQCLRHYKNLWERN